MKQWLLGFALAVCLLLPLSAQAEAAVVTEQEYLPYPEATYRLIYWEGEDGGLVLSRWEGEAAGALILPESIDGKPVRAIGARAFYNAAGFTGDLTIPEGITSIGQEAFSGCSGLTGGLAIPDSVVEIGYSAFQNCFEF